MAEEQQPGSLDVSDQEDGHDVINMVEVLEEEQKLEDDANAVLGASDAKHCTYPQGNLARQALYSCLTCTKADAAPGGVCLACSLECHEGHNLVELYTKRNFACDCGNSKFGENKCKLFTATKAATNENLYNQNFRGLYCMCHRPYPDPEDTVEDSMIQCVICEDWYHGRHLKVCSPEDDQYEELVCYQCVENHPFLRYYKHLQVLTNTGKHVTVQKESGETSQDSIDVTSTSAKTNLVQGESAATSASSLADSSGTSRTTLEENDSTKNGEKPAESTSETSTESAQTETTASTKESCSENTVASTDGNDAPGTSTGCILSELDHDGISQPKTESIFWKGGWRNGLCLCENCKKMYEDQGIPFITDVSDTIAMYERLGRGEEGTSSTQYERGLQALLQMDRVQQVEMMHGFNDLKTELKDYLKKFAENGKVVREEDIKEFFSQLASRKRQKVVDMSYFCK